MRHVTRNSSLTAVLDARVTNHAKFSYNLWVCCPSWRVHGAPVTTTPCLRQRTRGASAFNQAPTAPISKPSQWRRRTPASSPAAGPPAPFTPAALPRLGPQLRDHHLGVIIDVDRFHHRGFVYPQPCVSPRVVAAMMSSWWLRTGVKSYRGTLSLPGGLMARFPDWPRGP